MSRYVSKWKNGKTKQEHRLVLETALGRELPAGTIVHHANGNSKDNRLENLVVCLDTAHHRLLHVRMVAMTACGDPDARKCKFCKEHDDIGNMSESRRKGRMTQYYHSRCAAEYAGKKRAQKALRSMLKGGLK